MGESEHLPSLGRLEARLRAATVGYPRRRRRPFLVALIAAGIAAPIGIATADGLVVPEEAIVIKPLDVVTVGFADPVTGVPVRCPDGELLQRTLSGVDVGSGHQQQPEPRCSDGTVPDVYLRSQELWEDFIESAPAGTDLSTAPGLRSFVIDGDGPPS